MGHKFRDSYCHSSVLCGRRTVKEGESMGVWGISGKYRTVVGPSREWLLFSRVQFMTRRMADAHQYIVVLQRNGTKEHLRGPIAMFEDPLKHESITVKDAMTVDAFEVLVVYSEDKKGCVERHVVRGPTVFVPDVTQWVHSFSWTGAPHGNSSNKAGRDESQGWNGPRDSHGRGDGGALTQGNDKVAGALKFTKLRIIADQFYYDAKDVRTSDDAVLTVKIMMFFELADLEKMLNSTHDPIADFINACLADLMNFGSQRTYEAFVAESRQLSELETFPVLLQRSAAVGFRIHKVVYRGYEAGRVLQSVHDKAVQARTELNMKQEAQEQEQRQLDLELSRSTARGAEERKAEAARQAHRLEMEALATSERLRREGQQHHEKLRQASEDATAQLEQRRAADEAQLAYLQNLAGMGVDLTQYLVSQHVKVSDRVVRVVTDPAASGTASSHVTIKT